MAEKRLTIFLKITFILCLFFLMLGEIPRVNIGNDVVIKFLDFGIAFLSLLIIILIIKKKSLSQLFFSKPLSLFVVIAIFSLLINIFSLKQFQLAASGLYLLRWISFAAIYIVVVNFDEKFQKIVNKILVFVGIIILLIGYIQFFLYPNLRNLYYLGWDEHNYRMFSVFLDPNFAGAFFVLFLFFIVGIMMSWQGGYNLAAGRQAKQSSFFQSVYIRLPRSFQPFAMTRFIIILISCLTVAAIFLTYSRSAILMLVAGSVAYLILIGKKKLLVVMFGLIILILFLLLPTFNKENTNPFRITSSLARLDSYVKAIDVIKSHPIFGVGFNAYRYANKSNNSKPENSLQENHADAGSDSSLLFVAATTGVVGLAAYLYLWFSIFKRALFLYKKDSSIIALVVVCSIIGLFVNSIFINSLFFPPIMFWMWILIGQMEGK